MTDTKTTLTWVLKDEVSGGAKGLGATLAGLVNPTTLVIGGIAALTGGLIAATKAAADEQVNIEKLNAALVANVPGFDGNTDAIEKLIAERENLAFSDDELRASLALLLPGTKDVTEAQQLQAAAMDLARLKGVDLETATLAVAKASTGSTRELRAMGIEMREGATNAEILSTIATAAAGQAEAYASTSQAKWETLQIKFGDVVETVGSKLLPIIEDLLDFLIDTAIPAFEDLAELIGPVLTVAFNVLGTTIGFIVDTFIKPALTVISTLIGWVQSAIGWLDTLAGKQRTASTWSGSTYTGRTGRQHGGPVDPYGVYQVGEAGPETLVMGTAGGVIIPGGASSGGSTVQGVRLVGISESDILDMVDRGLYFRLQRAAPIYTNG